MTALHRDWFATHQLFGRKPASTGHGVANCQSRQLMILAVGPCQIRVDVKVDYALAVRLAPLDGQDVMTCGLNRQFVLMRTFAAIVGGTHDVRALWVSMIRSLASLSVAAVCRLRLVAFAQTTLKVSAIPDENPTELLRKFAARQIPRSQNRCQGGVRAGQRLRCHCRGLAAKLDMVWYGGFTFVQAAQRTTKPRFRWCNAPKMPSSRRVHHHQPGNQDAGRPQDKTLRLRLGIVTSGHLMPRSFPAAGGHRSRQDDEARCLLGRP